MSYGDLETHALHEVALQEAANLSIPPEALADREHIEGFAIDASYSLDRDDAIRLTQEHGENTLHVSIVDLGAFIKPESALQKYALRTLYTKYRSNRAVVPMIPRVLSEDKLSLVDGDPRPVVTFHIPVSPDGELGELAITHDMLTAQAVTPEEVGQRLLNKRDDGHLAELALTARALFGARHPDKKPPALEDEHGNSLESAAEAIGLFILQESMIAANRKVGQYFRKDDITALFRVHTLTMEEEEMIAGYPELGKFVARARYSVYPHEHLGLNITDGYAPVTSPLRQYVGLANHINLAAARSNGKEPSFARSDLGYVASRMARLEGSKEQNIVVNLDGSVQTKPHVRNSITSVERQSPRAGTLLQKINSGNINEGDLAHALFGNPKGTEKEVQATKLAAAEAIGREGMLARAILHILTTKGWVKIAPAPEDAQTPEKLGLIVTNTRGEEYPYRLTKKPVKDMIATVQLIGQMAGVTIDATVPERMTKEGKIFHNPVQYLTQLNIEKRNTYFGSTYREDKATGEITMTAKITIGGVRHVRTGTGSSKNDVERKVGGDLIREFDLIDNPPAKEVKIPKPHEKGHKHVPRITSVTLITQYMQRSGLGSARYTFRVAEQEGDETECDLEFVDATGEPTTITGYGRSKEIAKEAAARSVLEDLPPVPTKQEAKERKWAKKAAEVAAALAEASEETMET